MRPTRHLSSIAVILLALAAAGGRSEAQSSGKKPPPPLNVRVNQDATTFDQAETAMAANPLNPANLVAIWRDFDGDRIIIGYGVSQDGGATWQSTIVDVPNSDFLWDP